MARAARRPAAREPGAAHPRGRRLSTAAVILAAGGARRFGAVKQLAELEGRPLLQHALDAAADAPSLSEVVVVLGSNAATIAPRLKLGRARIVRCEQWTEGLAASLRAGVAALGDEVDSALVMLGDQPRVSATLIERIVGARGSADAVRAVYSGEPGHPVLLRGGLLKRVPDLYGDTGARELLAATEVQLVEVGDLGEATDIDEPGQLAAISG